MIILEERSRRGARTLLATLMVPAIALLAASCGGSDNGISAKTSKPQPRQSTEATAKVVSVYASLDAQLLVNTLVAAFKQAVPGIDARATFVTAASLAHEVKRGKADVVVSSALALSALDKEVGLDAESMLLGWDEMVIAVAPGNPKGITDLSVFGSDAKITSVLCRPETSCGLWTKRVLDSAHVTPSADQVSYMPMQMLEDVARMRTDAALLKRTTAAIMPAKIQQIAIPPEQNVRVTYRMVVIDTSAPALRFARFSASERPKNAIRARGYLPPRPVNLPGSA